ncbi:MAG: RNA polymerase factor sigma-32 [Oligoflexia bacterium]|nr:RNA polymerase factor sigma-32 [Oligoflexia bacterium]
MKRKAAPPKSARKPKLHQPEVLPAEETDELELEAEPTEEEIATSLPVPATNAARGPDAAEPELNDSDLVAVSPHDPFRRYLEELRRYPLLSPEEEFHLAMRLRDQGDLQAAKVLVSANLRLVVKIAFEYRTMYSNVLDLIQEGNIGLMKAVSKFDPTKGARLGYYASWWIRSYILKYLLDNFRLVKIGTTQAQKKLFYHLMREKERLEAQGLLAGPKLLAEKLNVREKDIVEMEQRLSGRGAELSLDAPVDRDGENPARQVSFLPDSAEAADEVLARQQLIRLLQERLPQFEETLNPKEVKILRERLLSEEPKTLQEVADLYGLTRERARQIEAKVIEKLREFLKPAL